MLDRATLPDALGAFGPATAAALIIAAYLVVAEPVVGLVLHRRFERAARHFDDARRWLYRRLLILEWMLVALCGATVWLAPEVDAASVGLRLPAGWLGSALTAAVACGGVGLVVWTARAVRRSPVPVRAADGVLDMLPRSAVERRLFAMVSVTAGCCEELIFRGFALAVLAALAPAAPIWLLMVAVAVVFALAHLYQGPSGIIATLLIGLVLGVLYLVTGSLIAPMVLHACVDLRAIPLSLLLAPRSRRPAIAPARHSRR